MVEDHIVHNGGGNDPHTPLSRIQLADWETFERQSLRGFAVFPEAGERPWPYNSGPWVTGLHHGLGSFETWPGRRTLTDALRECLDELGAYIAVECLLLSGSYIRKEAPAPKDIDGLAFYRRLGREPDDIRALARIMQRYKSRGIDVRLVPTDAATWISVKFASFFSALYLSTDPGMRGKSGIVLLVPDQELEAIG